jgi:hypothetical protein
MNNAFNFLTKQNNNYIFDKSKYKNKNDKIFDIFIDSLQLPFTDSFYALTVNTLDHYLSTHTFSIDIAEKCLKSIYNQINIFYSNNISVSYLDIKDILVIDDKFFIANLDKLYHFDHQNNMNIYEIYDKENQFLSPLFISNSSIPFISKKDDFIYTLALIVIYSIKYTHTQFSNLKNEEILDQIRFSKIYYTLKFSLTKDEKYRKFIIF